MPPRSGHAALLVSILAVVDVVGIMVAFCSTIFITYRVYGWESFQTCFTYYFGFLVFFTVVWPFLAFNNRLYISRRRDDVLQVVFDITKSVAYCVVFAGFGMSFYSDFFASFGVSLHADQGSSPRFLSLFGLLTLLLATVLRVSMQVALWSLRSHGHNGQLVLIVGSNSRARHLVRTIIAHPHYGYDIIGYLDDDPSRQGLTEEFGLERLGAFDDIEAVLTDRVIDEIYICLPVRSRYETIQKTALTCEQVGVNVRMVADLFPLRLATSRFHNLEDIPILALSTVPENQPQLLLQRSFDVVASFITILALSPLLIATACAIKLDTPGPILFGQERIGLNRRRFKMWKFRSMVANAEELREDMAHLNEVDGAMFKITDDPRITKVGRFIRRFSIDELPQIFNVLRGEMSMVGPRPPLPDEVEQYSWAQRRRLSVKPGMTGLSQVSGRSDLSFDETVYLDLYYIDQWSLALVFRILFLTVPAVLKARGAK